MGELVQWILLAALVVAAVAGARRYERLRRRVRRLEPLESALHRARADLARRQVLDQLRAADRPPRFDPAFRSQFGEDVLVWELFEGRLSGTFVECGAYDGMTLSVTAALEAAGWTGVLVEALPHAADACRSRRPGSRTVHAALSKRGSSGSARFTVVEGGDEAQMLSFHETNEPHLRHLRRHNARTRTIEAPLTTMDAVLEAEGPAAGIEPGGLDLAVLDVEGAELDLLDGFDLSRWRPRVMIVEDLSKGRDDRLDSYLRERGYVQVGRLVLSVVFVRGDDEALAARARGLLKPLE